MEAKVDYYTTEFGEGFLYYNKEHYCFRKNQIAPDSLTPRRHDKVTFDFVWVDNKRKVANVKVIE